MVVVVLGIPLLWHHNRSHNQSDDVRMDVTDIVKTLVK
jgi:hypothetical protein